MPSFLQSTPSQRLLFKGVFGGLLAFVLTKFLLEPASRVTSTQTVMFQPRKIAMQFVAREQSEGVGATVRRALGSYKLRMLDPFLMLDDAIVALPVGFPDHPHRGFETVTYSLPSSKGGSTHEDHLGNKGVLNPGDLQWMTAGRGIVHSEMPSSTSPGRGIQLWVNLPRAKKMMAPRYQEMKRERVPHVFDADKKVEALVFAGEAFGTCGPIKPEVPVTYIHFIMQKDSKLQYPIHHEHNAFIYVLEGSGVCNGSTFTPHQIVTFERNGDGLEISTEKGTEFLVISGQPLNEPVVQHGPFVMNTEEEIRQAFFDYHRGENGFEGAPTWQSENSKRMQSA